MKHVAFFAALLFVAGQAAYAGTANGSGALALASLIAGHSPSVSAADKKLLKEFLDGKADASHAAGAAVTISARALTCRAGNVDITLHSCALTFGEKQIVVRGRKAHELFATLAELGVAPEGAAGTAYEAISNVECTINAGEVGERGGGGAVCRYDPAN